MFGKRNGSVGTRSRHFRFEELESRHLLSITLPSLSAQTVSAGTTMQVALNGSDTDGHAITYTTAVSNSTLTNSAALTAAVAQGSTHTSIRMTVDDTVDNIHGAMVFQLADDLAPDAVAQFLAIVNNTSIRSEAFYSGLTFHRISKDFMIQGGDPLGTGLGGPGYSYDDEFNSSLQFTNSGVLALANSGSDTNGSQFFITTAAYRYGDYKYTIIGHLTEGADILDALQKVPVHKASSSSTETTSPDHTVTITSVTSFTDTENGVLRLSVPNGTTGYADVTVTATDSVTHETAVQTFRVTAAADTYNDPPYLNDVSPVNTTVNTPTNFYLSGTDVEGDSIYYDGATTTATGTKLSVTVNHTTGQVTVTPSSNVVGVYSIYVGVVPTNATTGQNTNWDLEYVPVYVHPAAPTSVTLLTASDTGDSNTDRLTNLNNTSGKTLQFQVDGVLSGAYVELFANGAAIGHATATGTSVTITTDGATALPDGSYTITAKQTLKNQTVAVGSLNTTVDLDSVASTALSVTIDATLPAFNTPVTTALTGLPYAYQAANNTTGAAATFSLVQSPTGMTINPTTGLIGWTPTTTQGPTETVKVRVRDAAGNSNEEQFTINVTPLAQVPPEITLLNGSTVITDGQTAAINIGSAVHLAAGTSLTLTIRNDGGQPLTLTSPFADTTHFTVSDPVVTSLENGHVTTFTITLKTDAVWSGSETISFACNDADNGDGDESTFTFVVSGTVTALPTEITILDGNTVLTDGQTTAISFGTAVHNGTALTKTFTIRNDGDAALTLTKPFADTTHFTVSDPAADSLAAGQSTTFTVTLNTGATWTGSEEISIASNDGDESPFTFVVSGTVTAVPQEITILDGSTVITSGQATAVNLGTTIRNAAALSKIFTIRNDGDQTLTLTTPPADTAHYIVSAPAATTLAPGQSTTFTVTLNTGAVWSGSEQITIGSNDSDESSFVFNVSGTVTTIPAEITILDGSTVLTDGQTTAINVGSAAHNATGVSKTFTIRNDGEEALTLTVPFADTTYFTVSDPAQTTLAPGQSTTFTVTLKTGSVWTGSETISIATNDTDENPFTFPVQGTVTALPSDITILDGTTVLTSGQTTAIALGSSAHKATGATKTFTIRNDGDQTLTLTKPFADTTHFTVSDPAKATLAAGESTTFTVTLVTSAVWTGSETLSLTNSDTDEGTFTFVVSGTVTSLPAEITVLDGTTVVSSGGTVAILDRSVLVNATSPTKTFTIRNDGDETLTLTSPFTGSTHFTVSVPGATTLAAGQSTTFTVTLKTDAAWANTETISLVSNDSDEGTFTIKLSGSVLERLHDASTIAVYEPSHANFFLRNTNTTGYGNVAFTYGTANKGWIAIAGDWNGDGTDTIGLYNPTTSQFFLRDVNGPGYAQTTFSFGAAGSGMTPIAGDWNGDGTDTVGLYDSKTGKFFLRNSNTTGIADVTFQFGQGGASWQPIVGDWNADRTDTVGLYNPKTSEFFLKNSNTTGYADVAFNFGSAKSGCTPVAGDWNNDGTYSVGLYDSSLGKLYLRNSNTTGYGDLTITYGNAKCGWTPLIGDWNGITNTLVAADGEVEASAATSTLNQADLDATAREAIARWAAAGLNASAIARMEQAQLTIADLSGATLGEAGHGVITIDVNAAGHSWFLDSTLSADEEFVATGTGATLKAVDAKAVDKIDLLTVVEHELGHIAGFDDLDALADTLMSGSLGTGIRRNA